MPTHSEVARLNLEYYRKQAKSLLKAAKTNDTECAATLGASFAEIHLISRSARRAANYRARTRLLKLAALQRFHRRIKSEFSGVGYGLHRCGHIGLQTRRRNSLRTPKNCRRRILCGTGFGKPSTSRPRTHRNSFSDRILKAARKIVSRSSTCVFLATPMPDQPERSQIARNRTSTAPLRRRSQHFFSSCGSSQRSSLLLVRRHWTQQQCQPRPRAFGSRCQPE